MKQKAPKVQLMWAVVRDGEVRFVFPTRKEAREVRDADETVVRVEIKVIK